MADSRETRFQRDIVAAMENQGWRVGEPGAYDRDHALYPEDLIGYFQEAFPDRWEKFREFHSHDPEQSLIKAVARGLDKQGTLDVLRRGTKVQGGRIETCSFRPDHGMNPEAQARYQANRLRVVPEVSYSPHAREGEYNPRLDLVLFVNGIPTATLELKSEFKQSVDNAKRQYCRDRPPKDPTTRKPEPLLTFKRGALVHFAVSQFQVAMTTRLAGKDTFFLPFDQGTADGGAGNPLPASEDEYATAYLWEQVFAPDAWLRVLGRFLHLQQDEKEDFHGRLKTVEKLIFPRYHQWDVVNRLLDATKTEGPGHRYLIQHSAGSGKSNSIAWTAHQLAALYDTEGERLFSSVIVVTDRTVLDSQLQETIGQFERTVGVVRPISRDIGSHSKSEQLAEALLERTRIIIVTIQTFPALFEALDRHPQLAEGRYAVIADEAHSSQTGSSAHKLKAILGAPEATTAPEDGSDEISAEDLLDAAVSARKPGKQISYYAFTATPKAKTLELFGREPDPSQPRGPDNLPQPFHVYSMRQAIEEGFILDVLKRYLTYGTAWKLAHPHADDQEVESRKASTKIARWVRLHPYNINQKVEVIVEHFRGHVRHLLDGQAKAMVVTGSRQEAVRYVLAMREYVKQKNYGDVHPLVAFSGTVVADEVIPEEVSETSTLLNPGLKNRDLAEAFDTDDFNIMIAANKFQTGFDQPKLCAMYVDKKLQGVDCVQTLSRLNRTFPGKETFVLDFFNDPEEILEAFEPYYNQAVLEDVSDVNVVFDLQRTLDDAQIYDWKEVEAFAKAFFDPKAPASRLSYYTQFARERFKTRYAAAQEQQRTWAEAKRQAEKSGDRTMLTRAEQELKDAGVIRDSLDLFRKNLQSFVRAYEFLSQIVVYDDPELEQLCVFARHLYPLLRVDRLEEEDIDVSELDLTHYRLTKRTEQELKLGVSDGAALKPMTETGSGQPLDPEMKRLSEIIERLNDLFGAEVQSQDKLHWINGLTDRVERDEEVVAQVRTHTPEQVMHGRFPKHLTDILLESMDDQSQLTTQALEDEDKFQEVALMILKLMAARESRRADKSEASPR
ncbi:MULTISPECIES: type I restriction endonuclease subunit R [unclassified Thioalkalivibrio]|uniref:type I restriction endonuclease subunit R n=1 Tax=unclassified Thioalkalivibrio TaxID=2621013 RepID=UPI00047728A5|nr:MULTISPECIES: DEAD/DEAH box helicase family protein [unclassified Thioalkalivibrio]